MHLYKIQNYSLNNDSFNINIYTFILLIVVLAAEPQSLDLYLYACLERNEGRKTERCESHANKNNKTGLATDNFLKPVWEGISFVKGKH